MKEKKLLTIQCPHCGYQYLPVEIFIPDSFFGRPIDIEREAMSGSIKDYFGSSMDLEETYICDKCNQPFKVSTRIQFITEGINFQKDYITRLKKESLFLDEE